jgi:lipopolysaccharide transport system ATP-binding protein
VTVSEAAIQIEKVGKRYKLGHRESYRSLRESLVRLGTLPKRLFVGSDRRSSAEDSFWALRDVSFSVQPGEIVGIIGRNGAGKSTLLKILSRITTPTVGRATMRGRVGSLLEVGTGFHPELSGRENIFLNGAILGMKRQETQDRFDEIVAFAEVEKFLDTAVKHYSSGMYMRLAFAVAAHLEPEILLVDEVLAVGDASFQKKCLNKMESVSRHGRTIFFVSHNMPSVTRLCSRAIMLENGTVAQDGAAASVVTAYLRSGLGTSAARIWEDAARAPGNAVARLRAVRARTQDGETADSFDIRRPIGIEMEYDVLTAGYTLIPNFHLYNEDGICVCIVHDVSLEARRRSRDVGRHRAVAWFPGNLLAEGMLTVRTALSTHDPLAVHFNEADTISFSIVDSLDGDSARGDYAGPMPGVFRPILSWDTSVAEGGISAPVETRRLSKLE